MSGGAVVALLATMASGAAGAATPDWTPGNPAFRAFYGGADLAWSWERIPSDTYEIAVHEFLPAAPPRGTVFVVHGFLTHTGLMLPEIRVLLEAGWEVAAIDLPGHGLSSGARADIGDFSDYGAAVLAAVDSRPWPKPWRALGHSTGCAALLEAEALAPGRLTAFFFEAPLVRSWGWNASSFGYFLLGWLKPVLPARTGASSCDPSFALFVKNDPLGLHAFPLSWFGALLAFQDRVKGMGPFDAPLTIIQGSADTVVDAAYNLPRLAAIFPKHSLHMIPGAFHYLFRDPETPRAAAILAAWAGDDSLGGD